MRQGFLFLFICVFLHIFNRIKELDDQQTSQAHVLNDDHAIIL